MKIAVLTYGTEGDTRPLAALTHALMARGHETVLLGDAQTLASADALNVPAQALPGDIRKQLAAAAQHGPGEMTRALAQLTNDHTEDWMRATLVAARDCDVIITSGLAGFVGLSVAEHLRIPAIGAGMIPLTPTREFASPFMPPQRVPRWLNRASIALSNQLVWLALRKALNRARAVVLDLPAYRSLPSAHPMLYGISPTLLSPPADWPSNAHICGQWLQPAAEWAPPPELAQFLAAGEAPLYIGFGSMSGLEPKHLAEILVAALAGRRAVFYPGWSGMDSVVLPDNILHIGNTPHDWLFPRMAAIVHHGGSGTAHSAARAGRPSVVIPFVGDQMFWAHRLELLGIAPPALHSKALNAGTLSRALAATDDVAIRERAAVIGRRMREEDGLAAGVNKVEALAAKRS